MKSYLFTLTFAATLLATSAFSQIVDLNPSVSGSVVSSSSGFLNSPEIVAAYANPGDAYRPPSNAYLVFQLPIFEGSFGAAKLDLTINQLGLGQASALRVSIRDVSLSSTADLMSPNPSQQTYEDLGTGTDYNSIFPKYVNASDFGHPLTFDLWHLPYIGSSGGVRLYLGITIEPLYYSSGYNPEFSDNGFARFVDPTLHAYDVPITTSGVPEPSTYSILMVAVFVALVLTRRGSLDHVR